MDHLLSTSEHPTSPAPVAPLWEAREHELLAQLLAYSRSDASATALLKHFPSLGHVLSAEPAQLRAFGMIDRDIVLLRLVRQAACAMAKGAVRSRPVLNNWHALLTYLQAAMAHDQLEHLRVLYLDNKNTLIADEQQQRGTVNRITVYPREVVKRALVLNASAFIVAHNHPSGDPTPSRDDIEMTRRLKDAADALEIKLHDHVVVGHGRHVSFRSFGLL